MKNLHPRVQRSGFPLRLAKACCVVSGIPGALRRAKVSVGCDVAIVCRPPGAAIYQGRYVVPYVTMTVCADPS
jgi:hypothetical protein